MEGQFSEQTKCPVCYEVPEGVIFQCKDGHILCHACAPHVSACPQCRVDLGEGSEKIRNRVLEDMLDKMKFECSFKSNGCTAKMSRKDITRHQEHCTFVRTETESQSESQNEINSTSVPSVPCQYVPFYDNLIENHSGQLGFQKWTLTEGSEQNGWIVENNPVGCDPLPEDPYFGALNNSCFVTSYKWSSKNVVIDLSEIGLTPAVLKNNLPLQIKCSQMYASRHDCGGLFRWELQILDSGRNVIREHKAEFERPPGKDWETAEYFFKFKKRDAHLMDQVCHIVFIHESKDKNFWGGHYGMKLARACVAIQPLFDDPTD